MMEIERETGSSPREAQEGAVKGSEVWLPLLDWFFIGSGLSLLFLALSGLLVPVLGSTAVARGAVLAALFLGTWTGMGLASGRPGSGTRFLLAAAVYLLISPWLIPLLGPLGGLGWSAGHGFGPFLFLLRFSVAFLAVAIPSACVGMAFSMGGNVSDGTAADLRSNPLRCSLLAAGATVGVVGGLLQIHPWSGDTGLAVTAAVSLLVSALLEEILVRRGPTRSVDTQFVEGANGSALLGGSFLWGLAMMASILAWERVLRLVFGPFPETTARVAGLFLGGCAIGSLVAAFLSNRGRNQFAWIPALAGVVGLTTAAASHLMDRLPILYLGFSSLAATDPFRFSLGTWGVAGLLILPPAIAWGALLSSSRCPSRLLLGGAAGIGLVCLGVMPVFGFRSTLVASAALLLASSAAGFARGPSASRWLRVTAILVILALTLGLYRLPSPGNPRLLVSGVHRYAGEILNRFKDPEVYRLARLKADLPFFREGSEATVVVERVEAEGSPILALTQDGVVVATTNLDLVPQILAAEIPLLLKPAARDALLIGYGSGIAAGSALLHSVSRLDLVEPEAGIVEASRLFEPGNREPRNDSRVRIFKDDPRQVLLARRRHSYDLILSRPSSPESSAARTLLTRQFYRLAVSRLRPGGLFAQAIPLQGLAPAETASILRTLRTAFADVMVLQTYYQEALVLASREPVRFDPLEMERAMGDGRVRSDVGRIGVASPESILVRYRLAGKGLEAFAGAGRILSDAGPPLPWSGYRPGSPPVADATLQAMDRYSTGLAERIVGIEPGPEGNARLLRIARVALGMGDAVRAADLAETLLARGDAADGHQLLGDAHYLRREQIEAVREWHRALEADPKHVNTLMSLADYNSDRQNYEGAEEYLRRALEADPKNPSLRFYHGRALYYLGRYKESESDLVKALAEKGEEGAPLSLYYLGLIQKEKKNFIGAAEFFRRYLQWAYTQGRLTAVEADVHLALAEVYKKIDLPDLAEAQKKAGEVLKERLLATARVKEKALLELLSKP